MEENAMLPRPILFALLTILLTVPAFPQAPPVREVGILPGDASIAPSAMNQIESYAARGGDQTLVVWTDYRSMLAGFEQSGMDILGIRLDPAGNPIDAVPFVIAAGAGWQQSPQATWNGSNWLVTFYSQDPTTFYYQNNIRGVRVSPGGVILDPVPLMLLDNQQFVRVGGQGGEWLITWYLPHSDGYGTYLVGRRLGNNGQFLDAGPVTLMDWTYPGSASRVLAANGEYLVIGQDWNSYDYRARRVALNGQPVGSAYTPISPDIDTNGMQYLATWIVTSSNYTLRCSPMSADGVLANPTGAQLYTGPFVPQDVSISHDGANWFVGWVVDDPRIGRVSPAGQALDPGGILVPVGTPVTQNTYHVQVVGNAAGGALVTYYDYRAAGDANAFVIPVSASGVPGSESAVTTGTPGQRTPAMVEGPDGQLALALISERTGNDRILVYFLSTEGEATEPEPIVVAEGADLGKPGIAWNGSAYMIVWQGAGVKARRMNPDGTFLDAAPIDVMPGFNVDVAALGSSFCVVASNYQTYPQYIAVYYRRIDGVTGALLDASPIEVGISYAYNARIHTDGARWLATWERHPTHDDPQSWAQYSWISADGSHTPEASANSAFTSPGGQPDVATNGAGRLFVWRAWSLSHANNAIVGRLMNADGSWASDIFTIAEAPGRQLRPVVGWDGAEYVVAWEDQRNQVAFYDQRTDIFGARVSASGVVLDPAGFAIVAGPNGEMTAAILSRADGVSYVASARYIPSAELPSYRVGVTVVGDLATSVESGALDDVTSQGPVFLPGGSNPFRGSTEVRFVLPQSSPVSLTVHEASGRRLRVLVMAPREAGSHTVSWDGRDDRGGRAAPGIYFVRLEARGHVATRKLSLLK